MDLANEHKLAKASAKILCSILNNIINIQIHQSLFCRLYFCSEFTKVSLYTVGLLNKDCNDSKLRYVTVK